MNITLATLPTATAQAVFNQSVAYFSGGALSPAETELFNAIYGDTEYDSFWPSYAPIPATDLINDLRRVYVETDEEFQPEALAALAVEYGLAY